MVVTTVNELRHYITTELKKVYDNYATNNNGNTPTPADMVRCLKREVDMSNPDDINLFKFYVIDYLGASTGNNLNWTESERNYETISGSKVQGGGPDDLNVPPNTEAFAVWCYENYRTRWNKLREIKAQFCTTGNKKLRINVVTNSAHAQDMSTDGFALATWNDKKPVPTERPQILAQPGYINVWGDSYKTPYVITGGTAFFSGWTPEGRKRYLDLRKENEKARAKPETKEKEEAFLALWQAEMGITDQEAQAQEAAQGAPENAGFDA
jgi:hypothetical protein